MDTNECSLCRPGGFALTRQMFRFAGIEIPEAGAAETESTDPAVPLRVIDIGCGTGGTMRWLSEHFPDWQISGLDKNPDVHEPGWIETGCAEKLPHIPDGRYHSDGVQLFQGCGTGGGAPGGVPGVKTGRMAFDERYVCPEERAFLRRDAGTAGVC